MDFRVISFRVETEGRLKNGHWEPSCEACVRIMVEENKEVSAAEGKNLVDALNNAFFKALKKHFSFLDSVILADCKIKARRFSIVTLQFSGFGENWEVRKKARNSSIAAFKAIRAGYAKALSKAKALA